MFPGPAHTGGEVAQVHGPWANHLRILPVVIVRKEILLYWEPPASRWPSHCWAQPFQLVLALPRQGIYQEGQFLKQEVRGS